MIQTETLLTVADNSGARRVKCFHILGEPVDATQASAML